MKKAMFVYHYPTRDLEADKRIAAHLKTAGVECWHVPYTAMPIATILKPDIVVAPELRNPFFADVAGWFKGHGVTVVAKRCEPGMTRKYLGEVSDAYKRAVLGNWDYSDAVDLELVWGQEFADAIVEYRPAMSGKVVAVGPMNFDPLCGAQPVRGTEGGILWATGFCYADRSAIFAAPEALETDREFHQQLVSIDRSCRQAYVLAMQQAVDASKLSRFKMKLRVHSGEGALPYHWAKGLLEVSMETSGDALRGCSVLIHAGSNMAYEAHLLGIPAFCYANKMQDGLVASISPNPDGPSALIEAIAQVDRSRSNANPEIIEALKTFYGPTDGNACKRAAEAILSMKAGQSDIPDKWMEFNEPKYPSDFVHVGVHMVPCPMCRQPAASPMGTDMYRCPFCGLAVAKQSPEEIGAEKELINAKMQEVPHGGNKTRNSV